MPEKAVVRRWRGFELELPEGLVDNSVLTFTEPTDGVPSYSLTVAFVPAPAGVKIEAYVADQLKQLSQELPGYQTVGTRQLEVAGAKAIAVEHQAVVDGLALRQVQTYFEDKGSVVILTATAKSDAKWAPQNLMDAFVQKLKRGGA